MPSPQIGWQQKTLLMLRKIYDEMYGDARNPLNLLSQAVGLCVNMRDHLQQAPGNPMLRETNRTVCDIGIACGFQSASYFSSVFRRETGLTPQDYRKRMARY